MRRLYQALLAYCLLGALLPAAAKLPEQTEQKVEQETLKAKATIWRESEAPVDNPSNLVIREAFPDKAWWEQFQDPHLSAYIQQAVNANLDLATAHERIEEARALARISLGRELPQLSLGGTFNRQRNSATIFRNASSFGQQNGASRGGGGGFALGQTINFYTLPLNASYEADIWRKNRDRTRAANKQAEAVERDFQTAHIILATDVANAYFNLLAADQLIELRKEIIATAESDLLYAKRRFEAGLVDEENVVLRQGRLTDFKALLQESYQMQALALNQLAVLMGRTTSQVGHLERADWANYRIPVEIAAGVPSELLNRRPDILAAEDRLIASGFTVRAARKELLPSITLNGQFGFSSASVKDVFDWDSRIAGAGASLAQWIYTGGQARANLRVTKSRYEQQLLAYRDTILQAFREVDDSLASLKAHRNAYQAYEESLASLNRREVIQQNRVAAGAVAEAEMNPVHLEVLQAQVGVSRSKLSALSDVLFLYKALGGGY